MMIHASPPSRILSGQATTKPSSTHLPLSRHRIQVLRPIIHGGLSQRRRNRRACARKLNQGSKAYDGIGAGGDETLDSFHEEMDKGLRLVKTMRWEQSLIYWATRRFRARTASEKLVMTVPDAMRFFGRYLFCLLFIFEMFWDSFEFSLSSQFRERRALAKVAKFECWTSEPAPHSEILPSRTRFRKCQKPLPSNSLLFNCCDGFRIWIPPFNLEGSQMFLSRRA